MSVVLKIGYLENIKLIISNFRDLYYGYFDLQNLHTTNLRDTDTRLAEETEMPQKTRAIVLYNINTWKKDKEENLRSKVKNPLHGQLYT